MRGFPSTVGTTSPSRIRAAHDDAKRKKLLRDGEFESGAIALGRASGGPQARAIARGGALRKESEQERSLFAIVRPGDATPEEQVWVCWRGAWYRLDFAFRGPRLALE